MKSGEQKKQNEKFLVFDDFSAILEVPRPREYVRTTSRIETVLIGLRLVQFDGLGPDF